VTALVRAEKLLAGLRPVIAADLPASGEITLLTPDGDNADAFVTLPAGPQWPGWQLALSLKDQDFLNSAATNRASVYLWTGILVMGAMGILTLLAIRLLRRQTALARLKNDLAATVSHELKTPLSSMRVLVDTLLESNEIEERKAREYLQLIARENERLSRLIQNFLTFSRIERKKYALRLAEVPASQIAKAAGEAVRERFNAPGCRFEVQIENDLPVIVADADALSTALINLLDNAWKYSEEIKHIVLRACVRDGNVVFSVRDNGIGIPSHERSRIFSAFHQADERLSRHSHGCGLGLSIVQFIVAAHHGRVSVESEPGRGSTFTIWIPSAAAANHWKEAVA
jgi:signal transduction histidine kinase